MGADFEKPMYVLYAIKLRLYMQMTPRRKYQEVCRQAIVTPGECRNLELEGTHRQGESASLKWRA